MIEIRLECPVNIIKLQPLVSSSQRSPDDSALQSACRLGDGEVEVKRAGSWEEREREGEAQTPCSPRRGPVGWCDGHGTWA